MYQLFGVMWKSERENIKSPTAPRKHLTQSGTSEWRAGWGLGVNYRSKMMYRENIYIYFFSFSPPSLPSTSPLRPGSHHPDGARAGAGLTIRIPAWTVQSTVPACPLLAPSSNAICTLSHSFFWEMFAPTTLSHHCWQWGTPRLRPTGGHCPLSSRGGTDILWLTMRK